MRIARCKLSRDRSSRATRKACGNVGLCEWLNEAGCAGVGLRGRTLGDTHENVALESFCRKEGEKDC